MIRVDFSGVTMSLSIDDAIRLCGMLLLRVREQDPDRVLRWLDLQEQAYAQYHHPESEPPIVVADAPIETRAVRMVREDLGWRLLTEAEADQQRERNLDDIMGIGGTNGTP